MNQKSVTIPQIGLNPTSLTAGAPGVETASAMPVPPTLSTISRALLDGLELSQAAWEDEEDSVKEEHAELIASQGALIVTTRCALAQLEALSGNAEQLRSEAASLLGRAAALDGKRFYVAIHSHRFGETAYPIWSASRPSEEQLISVLESDFEPERGEAISLHDAIDIEDLAGTGFADHLGHAGLPIEAYDPDESECSVRSTGG